ncbi:MAG: HD-GYP domain-containing protein [Treponema sp.]|nr:HD-GYP domain-containing protein [Treponema sp.]
MKKIEVNTLKPGLIFSEPVFIEENSILVPAGCPIREKDIEQLNLWGVVEVTTNGQIIAEKKPKKTDISAVSGSREPNNGAGADRKGSTLKFSITEVQGNTGPYRAYKSLIDKLDQILNGIVEGASVEVRAIDNISTQLLQELRDHRNSFVGFILGGEVSGYELAKSSINTAILSALIAQELKLANHKILHILTGAMLHDVGMLKLPKEIREKRGGLSDSELEQMKSHTSLAARIVSKELFYSQEISFIVQQHHERWDGKGYPDRLPGPSIDQGARIVSVADAFEAMVSKKSYRNSMVGYQAMKNLLADNSRRFDPAVIKAFAKIMGIYPIGSIVQLNNGAVARVVEVNPDASLRPKIQLIRDEAGKAPKAEENTAIDLLHDKTLFISKAIDPEEFARTNA